MGIGIFSLNKAEKSRFHGLNYNIFNDLLLNLPTLGFDPFKQKKGFLALFYYLRKDKTFFSYLYSLAG